MSDHRSDPGQKLGDTLVLRSQEDRLTTMRWVRALRAQYFDLKAKLDAFAVVEKHVADTMSERRDAALDHVGAYRQALEVDLAHIVEYGEALADDLGKHFLWGPESTHENTRILASSVEPWPGDRRMTFGYDGGG